WLEDWTTPGPEALGVVGRAGGHRAAKKVLEKLRAAAVRSEDGRIFEGSAHPMAFMEGEDAGAVFTGHADDEGFIHPTKGYITRREAKEMGYFAKSEKDIPQTVRVTETGDAGMLLEALEKNGGFTYDPYSSSFVESGGYMVGGVPGQKGVVVDALTPETLEKFRADNAKLLSKEGMFVGGWKDSKTGKIHLDVSERVPEKDRALELLKDRKEIAAWDLDSSSELRLPEPAKVIRTGTGLELMVGSDGKPVRAVRGPDGKVVDNRSKPKRTHSPMFEEAGWNPITSEAFDGAHGYLLANGEFTPTGELGPIGSWGSPVDAASPAPKIVHADPAKVSVGEPAAPPKPAALERPTISGGPSERRYTWAGPDGKPVEWEVSLQKDGKIYVDHVSDGFVDTNDLKSAGFAGRIGAGQIRRMMRFIEQNMAGAGKVTGWQGFRDTGAKSGRMLELPLTTRAPKVSVGEPAAPPSPAPAGEKGFGLGGHIPPQESMEYYFGRNIDPKEMHTAYDMAREAFDPRGPYADRFVRAGREYPGAAMWYDTRGMFRDAADEIGNDEAAKRVNAILGGFMPSSTARSAPPSNLKRAFLWESLARQGLVNPEILSNNKVIPASGFGHFAQNAHQDALARYLRTGRVDPVKNPKPASFGANLTGNHEVGTFDTVMARILADLEPGAVGRFLTETSTPSGGVDYSPRNWAYEPLERGLADAAHEARGMGLLDDVPAELGPTGAWQSLGWHGKTRSAEYGSMDDIWKAMRKESAKMWGVSEKEANRRIWKEGQVPLLPDGTPAMQGLIRWD
ncbi:MAG: hypothetical protein K0S14_242, partial [Thermomicrobiales bacterium]|nr:hypothetical protein [Thermomicrobiales bacterium]